MTTPAMSIPRSARPASQSRSRQTLERLLDAAEAVLREEGLDGATIENIARRAGVSVGIVYRRFPDKDALLRATYERFFETRDVANARALTAENWAGQRTSDVLEAFICGAVAGAKRERGLIVALARFAATHDDTSFRAYASRLSRATHDRLVAIIVGTLPPRQRGAARDRVAIAVDVLLLALRGYLIERNAPSGEAVDQARLVSELQAMIVPYVSRSTRRPRGRA